MIAIPNNKTETAPKVAASVALTSKRRLEISLVKPSEPAFALAERLINLGTWRGIEGKVADVSDNADDL